MKDSIKESTRNLFNKGFFNNWTKKDIEEFIGEEL